MLLRYFTVLIQFDLQKGQLQDVGCNNLVLSEVAKYNVGLVLKSSLDTAPLSVYQTHCVYAALESSTRVSSSSLLSYPVIFS